MAAGNDCWRFYESGILSSANNCPIDHDFDTVIVGIDRTGETHYWIVQNSWGTEWGNDGFIYLAVEEGDGVSGMNNYPQWILVDTNYPEPEPEPEPEPLCPNWDVDESQN